MRGELPGWRGLYAILDLPHAGGLAPLEAARGLVGEGVTEIGPKIVQLRAKRASGAERVGLVRALLPVVRAAGARLVVDDDVEAGSLADGVHLGQEDMAALAAGEPWAVALARLRERAPAGFLVGLSTHSRPQVERAAGLEVDYLGFGPILPTRSKAKPEPCVGFDGLGEVCEISLHPVVAIGGPPEAARYRAATRHAASAA